MTGKALRCLGCVAGTLLIVLGCSTDFGGIDVGPTGPAIGTDEVNLPAEGTQSFFTAFQVDPVPEDTAGPKFVIAADIDQDGLTDLVSAWNQNQPVQLHLQRRDANDVISFRTVSLGGTSPFATMAGLEVGQINDDGWLDIVVLVKATGFSGLCPSNPPEEISRLEGEIIVLFNPGSAGMVPDGDAWTEMTLVNPFVADRWIHNQFPGHPAVDFDDAQTRPEWSGFTALVVANIDGQAGDDILVVLNPGECEELGQEPPTNTVDLWVNPGPAFAESSSMWGVSVTGMSRGAPVTLTRERPQLKDIVVSDVDGDGDLDVIVTATNAISQNVRWLRNPFVPHTAGGPAGFSEVVAGFRDGFDFCIGGVNDLGPCPNGDADCVGIPDGICQGGICNGGEFDGADCEDSGGCTGIEDGICRPAGWRYIATGWEERPVGQLDTGADILTVGDVDNDGFDDVVVRSSVGRAVQWFRRPNDDPVVEPEFPPGGPTPTRLNFPWPVFTLTEFPENIPQAIGLGDVTGNGQNELMVAIGGGVFWYEVDDGDSVFDPWTPHRIIQDRPENTTTDPATGQTGGVAVGGGGVGIEAVDVSTHINTLLVADIDGDGKQDIVGTLDRRASSGLSDDRLVWYRNIRN